MSSISPVSKALALTSWEDHRSPNTRIVKETYGLEFENSGQYLLDWPEDEDTGGGGGREPEKGEKMETWE